MSGRQVDHWQKQNLMPLWHGQVPNQTKLKKKNKKTSSISNPLDCFSSQLSFENLMSTALHFMILQNHLDRYINRRGNFIVYNFPLVYLVNGMPIYLLLLSWPKVWELWKGSFKYHKKGSLFFNTGASYGAGPNGLPTIFLTVDLLSLSPSQLVLPLCI